MFISFFRCPQLYVYTILYLICIILYIIIRYTHKTSNSKKKIEYSDDDDFNNKSSNNYYKYYLYFFIFNILVFTLIYLLCKYNFTITCWSIVLYPIILFSIFIFLALYALFYKSSSKK